MRTGIDSHEDNMKPSWAFHRLKSVCFLVAMSGYLSACAPSPSAEEGSEDAGAGLQDASVPIDVGTISDSGADAGREAEQDGGDEIPNSECATQPCQNGGSCTDGVNGFTCECAAGYDGARCENDIDECGTEPCQNGGSCTDGVNGFTCECAAGYDGARCENDIDECGTEPCQNGGSCTDGVNGFTCECAAGYDGARCENDIDECATEPCQNGGSCTDGVNGFTCECAAGFRGVDCHQAVPRFVAFSGGGWHSHTALAGWIAGLLDASGAGLDDAFRNVVSVGANSGGGWFMTMLAYSQTFVADLEGGRDHYGNSGYLGEIAEIFDGAFTEEPCVGWDVLLDSAVAGAMMSYICESYPSYQGHFGVYKMNRDEQGQVHLNWHRLVHQVVYEPLELESELAGLTLASPHLPWAADKSLLYAATVLTDEAMLAYDQDAYLYWGIYASLSASPSFPAQKGVTPIVFTSLGDTHQTPQPALPVAPLSITHTETGVDPVNSPVEQVKTDGVSVVDASIASSAALAFGASYGMLESVANSVLASAGLMAPTWFMSGFAPPADIIDDRIEFRNEGRIFSDYGEVGYQTLPSLAARRTIRLGDGAYTDNSAVTTLVKHIQENQHEEFELVTFMNNTSPEVTLGGFSIPESIRDLFAAPENLPEPGVMNFCASPEHCLLTPSNHVFTPSSWLQAELLWSYDEAGILLNYFRVPVETQVNETYGIEAGRKGTLHLFVHSTDRTSALPTDQAQLEAYQDVYRVTRSGIATHGGAVHIQAAFGL